MPITTNPNLEPFHLLILGDGNFSFTQSLIVQLLSKRSSKQSDTGSETATTTSIAVEPIAHDYLSIPTFHDSRTIHVTATSFDSRQQLLEKYRDFKDISANIDRISRLLTTLPSKENHIRSSVTLLHEINAWELSKHFPSQKFDLILWNHPHLGTEDFRLHRFLLCHFFDSTKQVLQVNGRVMVSLVQGQEARWDIVSQAKKAGLSLQRVDLFQEIEWPGYTVKRNTYGGSFKNTHTRKHVGTFMKSFSYFFMASSSHTSNDVEPHRDEEDDVDILTQEMAKVEFVKQSTACQSKDNIADIPTAVQAQFFTSVKPLVSSVIVNVKEKELGADQSEISSIKSHSLRKQHPQPPSKKKLRMQSVPADLKCIHCSKQLNCSRSYRQHVHMVHVLKQFGEDWSPNREKRFACQEAGCNKGFASQDDLWQHKINKHSTVDTQELPGVNANSTWEEKQGGNVADQDYDYIPCHICGQAVLKREWGMYMHLESLKPAVGLNMTCPKCPSKFIESRALIQHYKFCRLEKK